MLDLDSLKTLKIAELAQVAQELGIQGTSGLKKQELIFKILEDDLKNQVKYAGT